MTNKISYKMAAFLRVYPQDGEVGDLPTRWRQRRVFESYIHKMAATNKT